MGFNNIETLYEFEVTPDKMREILMAMEIHEKNSLEGQTIRVKLNHRFAFVYKPEKKFVSTAQTKEFYNEALANKAINEKEKEFIPPLQ